MTSLFAAFVCGIVGWTLAEYLIHRFLGHVFVRSRSPFTVEHLRHHATTDYFSPTSKKALAAAATLAAVAPLASLVAGRARGLAFAAGVVVMYVAYEVVHRRAHTHAPRGPYSRWVRRNHFTHHFLTPRTNHGVTSPVWDHVFGTHEPLGVVRVPARHAMPWLLDPATGDVRAELAADYRLQRGQDDRP
jgi:sterol desaturase/sphingolipid hydroxylase (fatty acid hydroxylase superfamily)